ncbi:MAG: ATPase [Gaiellales bacterium]|nr:MAG: ATPase [Gaiellales bacterium]
MEAAKLRQVLEQIDGAGYKAYLRIKGVYEFPGYMLAIDHVQGDPYAAPSRLRVRVSQSEADYSASLFEGRVRRVALEDFIARAFARAVKKHVRGGGGTGKSGYVGVDSGGQEILERTAAVVNGDWVEVRFMVGLPADGRRCRARDAIRIFFDELPRVVAASVMSGAHDPDSVRQHVECAEDQEWLRGRLESLGLVAFLADGSVLPRLSGVSDQPLDSGRAVRFTAPPELRVSVELPNQGLVEGLGIPPGVTLVVGGGYHGKSTLLKGIERGVYNHIPGDGRERVVTRDDAVKIRAEDGRRVEQVDISPFIDNLPFGVDTRAFSTDNASGSTSQAANIIEALEAGCRLLVLDEDTSATNFMIRDELMQRLVPSEREPITPFIDQVRALYEEMGVSTILVMGGSGDYFEVADTVIAMEEYHPREVTAEARRIASRRRDRRLPEGKGSFHASLSRIPLPASIDPRRGRREKVSARGTDQLVFGRETIDLTAVEQLVDTSQTRAIGELIRHGLRRGCFDGASSLAKSLDCLLGDVAEWGLDIISPFSGPEFDPEKETAGAGAGRSGDGAGEAGTPHPGDYALPRRHEIAAALNRLRSLRVRPG